MTADATAGVPAASAGLPGSSQGERRPLVQVEGLVKHYPIRAPLFRRTTQHIHAVDDVSFVIGRGESLGLVGESGCGKTTTGRLLTRLTDATAGRVLLDVGDEGVVDIAHLEGGELKRFRRKVQMIFQDPYESMNPRRTVYDTVSEPLQVQDIGTNQEREERVARMLELVGLAPATAFMFRYPHELSGGQRQRVAIARALVLEPSFVVADEPTSMLDVSIRISIMELLRDLADQLNVSYLYITHDLAVARYLCDRIAVMYLGKIVELADTERLLADPRHPYTRALLAAVPVPDPQVTRENPDIRGGVSRPVNPPPACRFLERCPWARDICRGNDHPPLEEVAPGHFVACYVAASD